MPTIKYSDNPNEETAFVTQDGGQRNRAVLTAAVSGTIKYPDNPNSTKVTVTVDGVEHKAIAVADISGGGGGGGAVSSVNGKTGAVVLDAEDVGALPADTPIPEPGIPQYETMPTASASNVGEIAQYSGATIPDVEASATITQTTGSGLTDLQVNVDTFVSVEQPSGAETVAFTANVIPSDMTFTSVPEGVTITVTDADAFVNWIRSTDHDPNDYTNALLHDNGAGFWSVALDSSMSGIITGMDAADWANYGIVITGSPINNFDAYYELTIGSTTWEKDSETVDISAYGISYSGTPTDGDTISVAYTPFVAGITNGYFYKSSVEYSDPTATISQTVGSGLSDLSVNVDTFIGVEQPTQDEEVEFVCAGTFRTMSQTSGESGDISLSITNVDDFLTEIGSLDDVYIGAGSVIKTIYASGNGDDRPYQISVEYTVNGTNYVRWDLPADQYSVVVSGTSPEGTLMRPIENATVLGEDSWTKDNESVDIAAYGVSYSGSPTTGDTLTVAYTAPAPIGYSWEQTNVQPSSGGGNAGIEWKTKSDLEVGDNGYRYLTIPSGLPDGIYEFYIQIKNTNGQLDYYPLGYKTYKILMKVDSSTRYYMSLVCPVLDGDYATSVYPKLQNNSSGASLYISGSDMIFELSPFRTNVREYTVSLEVPDCYKLSAIKNTNTGDEYVGTLSSTMPAYDNVFSVSYDFGTVDELPYVPRYVGGGTLDFSNGDYVNISDKYYGSNTVMLRIGFRYGFDEYEADMALYRNGHSIKVRKATGVFAQTEFVKDEDRRIFIKLNAPVGTTGSFVYVVGGISEDSIGGMSMQTPSGTPTVLSTDMVGGIVDTNNIDIISQYVGTTTASYTNGCFYKATGTIVTVPESAVCTETTSTGTTITCTNISGLINKLSSLTGWSTEYVKDSLSWSFFAVSQDQTSISYSAYGTWSGQDAADLIAYFSFSPALSDSIEFRVQYVPATQEVQNGAWVLVDTQFTGITGYDATKTQVLKNVLGVLTWVDE